MQQLNEQIKKLKGKRNTLVKKADCKTVSEFEIKLMKAKNSYDDYSNDIMTWEKEYTTSGIKRVSIKEKLEENQIQKKKEENRKKRHNMELE